MNADKCPHCGSPRTSPLSAYWTCKADTTQRDEDGRTHLCREREAHNKTKWENVKLRELLYCAADDLQHWDETVRAKAQRELYDFLEKGAALAPAPEEPANPTCSNTTHKLSHCDCKEPVSLDHAPKITHEGNTDAKFKQLHEVASIIVEYIEDPDRRKHYRSEIQQLTPTTEETSEKDTSTETCPSQKDTEWRELGPDEERVEGEFRSKHPSLYEKCKICGEEYGYHSGGKENAFCRRTRRPLCPNDAPKQEEMPLDQIDESLKWIEGDGKYPLDHDEMFGEVCNCIRYLRDEIQKLKEAR